MSIFLLQSAFGSALGILLAPAAEDPKLVGLYGGLCVGTLVAAGVFWWSFRGLNEVEEGMNALEDKGVKALGVGEVGGGRVVGEGNPSEGESTEARGRMTTADEEDEI